MAKSQIQLIEDVTVNVHLVTIRGNCSPLTVLNDYQTSISTGLYKHFEIASQTKRNVFLK